MRIKLLLLFVALLFIPGGLAFGQVNRVVHPDSVDCTSTNSFVYASIGAAVTAAGDGDTIVVCDGTYIEQVDISEKSGLTVTAANALQATVNPPPGAVGPIIKVINSTDVSIDGLTVDSGNNFADQCNAMDDRIAGIRYQNSTGKVSANSVSNIKHTSEGYLGCQEGIGIWVSSDEGESSNVIVEYNTITDYQKNGVTVNSPGSAATVSKNYVEGFSATLQIAQNGIQFGFGASGEARGNHIKNNYYSGSGWSATALLLFDVDAKRVKHSLNKFEGNQNNLILVTASACPNIYGGFYEDFDLCSY
jgi:hypothetical protein